MFTSNGQSVYLGQQVKTGMQAACEPSIIKRIDTENEAVFVVPLTGGQGGWYSVATIKAVS